jgi:hypothetical protein
VGEKMAGVTVSAKAEGQTITTGVFTDEAGGYGCTDFRESSRILAT